MDAAGLALYTLNDEQPKLPPFQDMMDVCEELGIEMLWEVGGGKIQSSSDLVKNSKK